MVLLGEFKRISKCLGKRLGELERLDEVRAYLFFNGYKALWALIGLLVILGVISFFSWTNNDRSVSFIMALIAWLFALLFGVLLHGKMESYRARGYDKYTVYSSPYVKEYVELCKLYDVFSSVLPGVILSVLFFIFLVLGVYLNEYGVVAVSSVFVAILTGGVLYCYKKAEHLLSRREVRNKLCVCGSKVGEDKGGRGGNIK